MVGSKNIKLTLLYAVAIVVFLLMIFPYVYMVLQSLAPWDQVDRRMIPTHFTLRSYKWLFFGGGGVVPRPWLRAFLNSMIVTTSSTFLMMIVAILTGYSITKLKFKGSRFVHNVILFQMFYPAVILLIPLFLLIKTMGLYNSYLGMILPKAVDLWAIFMYINFFKSIPDEVIESAKVDGAGALRTIWKIVLPMSKSITTIIFLFLFMVRWVELLWDMIVVNDPKMLTLNVMLAEMFGPYGSYPGPMYAGSVLLTLPILILFIIFSKNFKEGMDFAIK